MHTIEETKLLIEEAKARIRERKVAAKRLKTIRLPKATIDGDAKIHGVDPHILISYLIGLMENSPAQSYGSVSEACFLDMLDFKKVKASEALGDCHCDTLGHIEVKVSMTSDGGFSIQQVRTKRPLAYYLLCLYDLRSDYLFFGLVPKDVINSMVGSQSHGTKESSKHNADPEFCLKSIRVAPNGTLSENLAVIDRYNSVVNPDYKIT